MSAPFAQLLATALAATPWTEPPPSVELQVVQSVAVPGARIRVASYRANLPADCTPSRVEVPPLTSSGQVGVRLYGQRASGAPCDGWAWVKVQLFVNALVTRQAVDAGGALEGAVVTAEKELTPGRTLLTSLPAGAAASRRLGPGVALELSHLRENGPQPGQSVTVVLNSGSLRLEQQGRAVPCTRGMACALLPNGRRVEGRWDGERINLEQP